MNLPRLREHAVEALHRENHAFLQAQNYQRSSPGAGGDFTRFAAEVERRVIQKIEALGLQCNRTTNNAPWDVWVEGARVEIKAARWSDHQNGGGRYQAAIRNHQADVLVLVAVNGSDHFFVIPVREIEGLRSLAITSYDVSEYEGKWAVYRDRWDLLIEAVESARARGWQPKLIGGAM